MNFINMLSSLLVPGSPFAVLIVWAVLLVGLLLICARRADGSPYLRLKFPLLLVQILHPDSRKCGFAWSLFIVATYAAFVLKKSDGAPAIDADKWLMCVGGSSALMGFGTIADAKHQLEMAKINAAAAPVTPATPGEGA